jgi:hypothetical protein
VWGTVCERKDLSCGRFSAGKGQLSRTPQLELLYYIQPRWSKKLSPVRPTAEPNQARQEGRGWERGAARVRIGRGGARRMS